MTILALTASISNEPRPPTFFCWFGLPVSGPLLHHNKALSGKYHKPLLAQWDYFTLMMEHTQDISQCLVHKSCATLLRISKIFRTGCCLFHVRRNHDSKLKAAGRCLFVINARCNIYNFTVHNIDIRCVSVVHGGPREKVENQQLTTYTAKLSYIVRK